MQCPIGRAPHTMAFDNSVMGTLRGPWQRRDSAQQPAECEARTLPPLHWDAPCCQRAVLYLKGISKIFVLFAIILHQKIIYDTRFPQIGKNIVPLNWTKL